MKREICLINMMKKQEREPNSIMAKGGIRNETVVEVLKDIDPKLFHPGYKQALDLVITSSGKIYATSPRQYDFSKLIGKTMKFGFNHSYGINYIQVLPGENGRIRTTV